MHMANCAGNPVKTVSEPGVVADFNARNHCIQTISIWNRRFISPMLAVVG
jgi:hypothetical protein